MFIYETDLHDYYVLDTLKKNFPVLSKLRDLFLKDEIFYVDLDEEGPIVDNLLTFDWEETPITPYGNYPVEEKDIILKEEDNENKIKPDSLYAEQLMKLLDDDNFDISNSTYFDTESIARILKGFSPYSDD